MALRVIEYAPVTEEFTLLAEYSAQTPQTFNGKPVLHQLALATTLKVPDEQYQAQVDVRRLSGEEPGASGPDGYVHVDDIDVWVTDRNIILYAAKKRVGLQVPYPAVTITAQDGAEVMLELNLSSADTADEDLEVLQLRISPNSVMYPEDEGTEDAAAAAVAAATPVNGAGHASAATALFKAISACQELNPDPRLPGDEGEDGEEGDGEWFDETAPGATGWITSENMADFMDENGNFRMPADVVTFGEDGGRDGADGVESETAPAVAGSVRTRSDAQLDDERGDSDENKWQRTG